MLYHCLLVSTYRGKARQVGGALWERPLIGGMDTAFMKVSLSYREKLKQADKEAKATVVVLILTIAVWLLCGIGLSGSDIVIFHTPIWIVGGTIGTWIFTVFACIFLAKRVFVNFNLDEEGEGDNE